MSTTITENFVKQFSDTIMHLSQQKGSRLGNAVRVERQQGKDAYYDRIDASSATKKTTRHGNTPNTEVEHSRRKVTTVDYEWAPLIDRADLYKLKVDPQSHYVQNGMWAMGRARDDEIISAFFGTAYAGEEGTTAVTFPAGKIVAHGSAGLTLSKLIAAKLLLDAGDTDPDEERFCAITAKQLGDLLATTEVKSADYNNVKALVEGRVDTFMGFKFIRTERLGVNGSSHRLCPAWVKSGMLLSVGMDVTTRITERADKSHSTQVFMAQGLGAVRMEEAKVVQIPCVES